ncbi:MAG: lipid-A-disaccharide synthase N-terminal domain-containing protein [Verrucomicrobiales bacterium]|nr:lipid-A-disaccharide synthase N-terminal domain-containing protein [Verrucomicrobiales bacterium]
MRITRKQVVIAAVLLLVIPAIGWWVMIKTGLVGQPGKPVEPPFNLSDRIATIEVVEGPDGELRGRFDGWKEGDTELSGTEFFAEIYRRNHDLNWFYKLLDVTSLAGVAWVVFGFLGQAVFMGRMIVQIIASEKVKSSVVPPAFWWLSLLGSSMLMVYFIWRKELVGFLGQSTGWVIYIRNLWLIYGRKNNS